MNHHIRISLILAMALLLAACGKNPKSLKVDATTPVGYNNRIIYQMNIGAFTSEGTIRSAMQQLDRLDTLGIDIIWLMPIYPRGATMNSPYAVMNYKSVNSAYGTVADLKNFVARAHDLGMIVWLDWVPNHVAQENAWVYEHPDFFSKDTKGNMIHPHGWGDVLELNYQNDELVKEMNCALRFWVEECDVDGFRCDYVSSPTIPVGYWQDVIAKLKSMKEGKMIEMMCETDITDPNNQRIDSCGFDYDYAWNLQGSLVNLCKQHSSIGLRLQQLLQRFLEQSGKIKNRRMVYLTNHDQNFNDGGHTLKDFYGDYRYALTVLEFTFYGMPLLYNGQEIGDPDVLNYFTDSKVKWEHADLKMQNTVRTLIALHHQYESLAADAPVKFLSTSSSDVLAYSRGDVVVVLNFSQRPVKTVIDGLETGTYNCWLNSRTITEGPLLHPNALKVSTNEHPFAELEECGYAVYVKE
jgi:glycosidase